MTHDYMKHYAHATIGTVIFLLVGFVGFEISKMDTPRTEAKVTETTIKIYAMPGDGNAEYKAQTNSGCGRLKFDAAKNSVTGTAANATVATKNNWTATGCANNGAHISRGFLSFDTSNIPDDATITDVKLYVYILGKTNAKNDGNDFVSVTEGMQTSQTELTTSDYAKIGSVEGSNRLDIGTMPTTGYASWTLNTSGIAWVRTTGYTKLSLREGHDILGAWPNYANTQRNAINVALSEQTGTTQDPYIEVTYTRNEPDTNPPSIPQNLMATSTSSRIDLVWGASTDDTAVAGYIVYRDGVQIGTVTDTSFSDANLVPGSTYAYTVAAYDAESNVSAQSDSVIMATSNSIPPGPIGYVGCSMTQNAVNGYWGVAGTRFWEKTGQYSGGGIYEWSSNLSSSSKYWNAFSSMYALHPDTKTVWWELCTLNTHAADDSYENALIVLDEIKRRIPGVIVYVSAQPNYVPSDYICPTAGEGGPARMETVAQTLVDNGDALAGQFVGPLAYPDQIIDSCHANQSGEEMMGNQLVEFFGL